MINPCTLRNKEWLFHGLTKFNLKLEIMAKASLATSIRKTFPIISNFQLKTLLTLGMTFFKKYRIELKNVMAINFKKLIVKYLI